MMKWKYCVTWILLLGGLTFVLPISGEQTPQDKTLPQTSRDIYKVVEMLREEQVLRELKLDEKRTETLLKNIRTARQLKNSYRLQKYLIENELDALLNYSTPNQEDISAALQKLELTRFQYYQALLENEQELRQLLSPEEQACYLLFQRRFNKRLQELIVKIRQRNLKSKVPSNQILRQQPQESVIRKQR